MDSEARRRRAYYRGHAAELVAAALMMSRGYTVLERRYKTPVGEIDLIAKRGRRIAFVEVKLRPSRELCRDALTTSARNRIHRAADFWLARNARYQQMDLGFDAVFLVPWRIPAYERNVL